MQGDDARRLTISEEAFRHGCERAEDWFLLQRLRAGEDASGSLAAAFDAFGVTEPRREALVGHLREMLWVTGDPLFEATMTASMLAGVLVGLMLADGTVEAPAAPDAPPADLVG